MTLISYPVVWVRHVIIRCACSFWRQTEAQSAVSNESNTRPGSCRLPARSKHIALGVMHVKFKPATLINKKAIIFLSL